MRRGSMLALLVLLVAGCQGAFQTDSTFVTVPFPQGGGDEEVWVESSLNRDSKLGVRYLGAGAWGVATNKLNLAIASGDDDARTHFALGVAYELDGNYHEAKAHYELALERAGVSTTDYEDAVRRIRVKLGEAPLTGG